jgi:hypothetical protein
MIIFVKKQVAAIAAAMPMPCKCSYYAYRCCDSQLGAPWSSCTDIKTRYFRYYRLLQGTLPDIWVGLTQLRTVDLASNLLSGVLPLLWGRLGGQTHSLQLLVLEDNPCMDANALRRSIEQSGILSSGRARVLFSGTSTRTCTIP